MRQVIIEKIVSTLEPLDFVLALWQGGSAAHGCSDEWSDIDIAVVVEDNCVQETFDRVEKALAEVLGTIYRPYRYDFKLKYFSRDFPPEVVDLVTPLFCIANLEDLAAKQQTAASYFAEILPIAEQQIHNYLN